MRNVRVTGVSSETIDKKKLHELDICASDVGDAIAIGDMDAIGDSLLRLSDGLKRMKITSLDCGASSDITNSIQVCSEEWINHPKCVRVLAALSATDGTLFQEWLEQTGTDIVTGLSGVISDEAMVDNEDNWILLANACLVSEHVTNLVMSNIAISDLTDLIYDSEGEIRSYVLPLINAYCNWLDEEHIDEMLHMILSVLARCYSDEDLSNDLFKALFTLRKMHDITPYLFRNHNFDGFCELFEPDPASSLNGNPRALCFLLQLHAEAIENGLLTEWANWTRIGSLALVQDLPSNVLASTLWILCKRADAGDLPMMSQEMIDRLIDTALDGSSTAVTSYATLLLAWVIQKQVFTCDRFPLLMDHMCAFISLSEYDSEICSEVAGALIVLTDAFPEDVRESVTKYDLSEMLQNGEFEDNQVIEHLMRVVEST